MDEEDFDPKKVDYSHITKHPYLNKVFCWIGIPFIIQNLVKHNQSRTSSILSHIYLTTFYLQTTGTPSCMQFVMETWN